MQCVMGQVMQVRPSAVDALVSQLHLAASISVSPVVSVEPRVRKFHQPVTITLPLSCSRTSTLRLLCSMSGGSTFCRVKLEPHRTDTDTDTYIDIRDAPIV